MKERWRISNLSRARERERKKENIRLSSTSTCTWSTFTWSTSWSSTSSVWISTSWWLLLLSSVRILILSSSSIRLTVRIFVAIEWKDEELASYRSTREKERRKTNDCLWPDLPSPDLPVVVELLLAPYESPVDCCP